MVGGKLVSVGGILLLVGGLLAGPAPARARDADPWPVKLRLLGPDGGKSTDVSGIACTTTAGFPRFCFVIDDNSQSAQLVTLEDGKIIAGEQVELISNKFKKKTLELDGEGVAFAEGFFYVIGSHGHPRDKKHKLDPVKDKEEIDARIIAASQMVRLKAAPNGTASVVDRSPNLRKIITAQPELQRFAEQRLENNGVTIEGIAIRGKRVFVGFRGPTLDNGRAPILSAALDALFGGGAPDARLYQLPLGDGQGVRDLAPLDNGFLILAGPTADGPGRYAVYWWDGDGDNVRFLRDLADIIGDHRERKPEALLPLDKGSSGLRVLILSDGAEEGAPTAVTMPAP
jgi:uncharacterized protein DUF3616